jgi:hypothetical protein
MGAEIRFGSDGSPQSQLSPRSRRDPGGNPTISPGCILNIFSVIGFIAFIGTTPGGNNMEPIKIYRVNTQGITTNSAAALTNSSLSPQKPKLLDQVRQAIRRRHYSDKTEKAYIHWIKRYIFFITSDIREKWARRKLVDS